MTANQGVVLVVDDDATIREMVKYLLEGEGYQVLCARDGQDALDLSRRYRHKIHLTISDVEMPGLGGTDLCFHLLAERPGIRILLMSGEDRSGLVVGGAAVPFLLKPFDGTALRSRVQALLAVSGREMPGDSGWPARQPGPH